MTIDVFHGMFAANSASGNQSIAGVGFSGKVFLFYSVNQPNKDGSFSGHYRTMFGFSTGVDDNRAVACNSSDIVTNSDAGSHHTSSGCVLMCTASGTIGTKAAISAIDSNGFTLNWTHQLAALAVSGWIGFDVLGGVDVRNWQIKSLVVSSGHGTMQTSGTGFSGNIAMLICADITRNRNQATPGAFMSIGMATSPSEQFFISTLSEDGSANADTWRWHRTNRFIGGMTAAGAALCQAEFVGFHSDGMELNWISGAGTSGLSMSQLLIKVSGNAKVVSWNTISGTGNQDIGGVGFSGKYLMLASTDTASNNSDSSLSNNRISIGSAINSNDGSGQTAIWAGDQDGVGTMVNTRGMRENACFLAAMENSTDSSTSGTMIADFTSFGPDGYSLNKSVNAFNGDTSGMTISSLVIGDTISGAAVVQDVQRRAFGGGNNMQFPGMAMGDFGGHMQAYADNRVLFGQPKIPNMMNVSGMLM